MQFPSHFEVQLSLPNPGARLKVGLRGDVSVTVPDGPRCVVLPTYNGARKEANLTPLLALLLQRFGIPVVVHGLLEGFGRVTSALIFRELGVMPATSSTQAQAQLDE